MCGIAGMLTFDGSPVHRDLLERMTQTLRHRGPDGDGLFVDGCIGLGHRRLAIVDLTPAGAQPMTNEDGSLQLTYNGEIYNHCELRRELVGRGHRFRSQTDTEVILHSYEEWGVECLSRFQGMFAFGLWDTSKRRLWLARDRLGVKPLFYRHDGRRLHFGSEIKAILADPSVPREIDYEALAYFLALNWMPAPHTLFAGIRQLQPGHHKLVEADGTVTESEYWDLRYPDPPRRTESEWIEAFSALMQDAVRGRMDCEVPYGAFLSGGLDSSAVAYWMTHQTVDPVRTFSVRFQEPTFDESHYARAVAESLGTTHHEESVLAKAAETLPELVRHSEEPTADSSMLPLFHLARSAAKQVKVVLTGDGADELLAGYETYSAYHLHRHGRRIPSVVRRRVLRPLVEALPVSEKRLSLDFKLRRFVRALDVDSEEAHASWRMIFAKEARDRLLQPAADRPGAQANVVDLYRHWFARCSASDPLNRRLYVDTRCYLPNDMLVKVDRMTMAHSLEARGPFLDYRVAEFAASLPISLKLRGVFGKKRILRESMRGRLPQQILTRPKQGFNVPNARWFRGELRDFTEAHLAPSRLQSMGYLETGEVQKLLAEHGERRADHSHQLWGLLTLSLWHEEWLRQGAL